MLNTICDKCEYHHCTERNAPDTSELTDKHDCEYYHRNIANQFHHALDVLTNQGETRG